MATRTNINTARTNTSWLGFVRALFVLVGIPVLVGATASTAGGQMAGEDRGGARLIEAELLAGYTPVALESWTGTTPISASRTSYGANVRAYLIYLGTVRMGIELGQHHFFTWKEVLQPTPGTIERRTHNVSGFHFAVVARACERPRFDCDAGYGFYFLDSAMPGAHFGMNYIVTSSKRFRIPIGARIGLLLSGESVALPLFLKTGVTF